MDTGVIISIILAVVGIAITIVIWIASTRAVRYQQAQQASETRSLAVDEKAYVRARDIYEGAINQLESEATRLNSLVTTLNKQVVDLNTEIAAMRKKGYNGFSDSGPQPKVS